MSWATLYLLLATAVAGAAGMALEMAASRLLLPYYGDSHLIWANLIGLILAALSIGYYFGGMLADRHPTRQAFALPFAAAGTWILAVPLVGPALLAAVQGAFAVSQFGLIASSLIGVTLLFGPPSFALGCIYPFAIKLLLRDVRSAGNVAGSVYAVSTIGSMAGTFGAVLWLMPSYGVRVTFVVVAVLSLATAATGLATARQPTGAVRTHR